MSGKSEVASLGRERLGFLSPALAVGTRRSMFDVECSLRDRTCWSKAVAVSCPPWRFDYSGRKRPSPSDAKYAMFSPNPGVR